MPSTNLQNKTVTLFWGETNTWRRLPDGQTGSSTPTFERLIYISSAGRPFVRVNAKAGSVAKQDFGPDANAGRFAFEGLTMTNFAGRAGLLRKFTVTFDPAFSSCTATVAILKDGPNPKTPGIDGAQYETLSISAGQISCSVKNGNSLAN